MPPSFFIAEAKQTGDKPPVTAKSGLLTLGAAGMLFGGGQWAYNSNNTNISDQRSEAYGTLDDELMGIYGDSEDDMDDGTAGGTGDMTEEEIAAMDVEDLGTGIGVNGEAKFKSFGRPDQRNAYADGEITVGGKTYPFRSGGGGNGYLPPGEYVVSNGRRRSDVSSMQVGGYGYSFDLSDSYDKRVGKGRSLLRIHPDGGNPGTLGCIGVKGNAATQKQFYESLQQELQSNGGKIKIKVG
jgi:hypothetical protein